MGGVFLEQGTGAEPAFTAWEALALTWADYDDYSKTILIDKNMVYVDGEKITQTPKTESGERVIVLNKQAVMDLKMLRK